jgi:protein O-GlcNAc transferase
MGDSQDQMGDSSGPPEHLAKRYFHAGRFEDALRLLDKAVATEPQNSRLWNNRGAALAAMKRYEAAQESFTRALSLEPELIGALANRAPVLMHLCRYEDAIADYERLLRDHEGPPFTRGNLIRAKLQCCDWQGLREEWGRALRDMRTGKPAIPPMVSAALCETPKDQLLASRILSDVRYPAASPSWKGEIYRHERIRIGYLSADFHAHATATLMAGLLEAHDRARFEIFAFAFGPDDRSPMRNRLANAFEHFLPLQGKTDNEIAGLVRANEIDIAVDLKGFTDGARPAIFSSRPAPLQVNYLGFPATMGAPYMDYIIADPIVIPAGNSSHYSEKIAYLPHSYQPNDNSRMSGETPTRAQERLPPGGFVFCCFNSSYKITPQVFDIWMQLLGQVNGSVLWLLGDTPAAERNLRREVVSRGVAAERIVFAARKPVSEHLARHRLADLFLDTRPYNAHTTASDALWMGLPLVTCPGATFPSRVAASLLTTIGMPELVTGSPDEYHRLALTLARTPERLAAIRAKLARNREASPLFDAALCARHIESAYMMMHERQQRGEPPVSFTVKAHDA